MKISFDVNIDEYVKSLEKKVKDFTTTTLNKLVDTATKYAQQGYDRFVPEVASDDPYVFVFNSPITQEGNYKYSREIRCVGNQVLFIEFGAGLPYYTETELRLYQNILPINPRPNGIHEIGTYGDGRGMDGTWFYKSYNGRESETTHWIKDNLSGEAIMLTHGSRPARALYRGVGMAVRKLIGGKL